MEVTHAPVAPLEPRAAVSAQRAPAAPALEPARRLASLDVFRGLTMLFMASEIMRIPAVAAAVPGQPRRAVARLRARSRRRGPASSRGT